MGDHLLGEALVPELGEQTLGVLERVVKFFEEARFAEGSLGDLGGDLGNRPLELLCY